MDAGGGLCLCMLLGAFMTKEEVLKEIENKLHRLTKPEFVPVWYTEKVPAFNFRTPKEMIELGLEGEVLAAIDQIEDGVL